MSSRSNVAGKLSKHYDLIVIGAGSAGFSAAITASEGGKKVALVGHGTIGGTCVNVGCVPSKTMIRAAEAIHAASTASRFPGLSGQARVEDWRMLIAGKDDLVSTLRQKKYADLLPSYEGIDYIEEGPAQLVEGGVEVGNRILLAPKTIVATGSRPTLPDISGIEQVPILNSTALFELEALPQSLVFVGGGYIGAELAQMMARFGVKVSILMRSHLLPGAEPEISAALKASLLAENISIYEGVTYSSVTETAESVSVYFEKEGSGIKVSAEQIFAATGRRANSDNMGLEAIGVELDKSGSIIVDKYMQTTAAGIYAAGDVTNCDQFVYMAAYGAKLAARNAVLGEGNIYDNSAMPWVVFSDPQIAGVGLGEAEAIAAGYEVKTSSIPMDEVPRALAARDTRGLVKLVADKKTDRLLGGQIIAPEGSDTIQTLVMALKSMMTAKELGETIFPYLTNVEALKLAAQTFDKDVSKLSCCAG